MSKSISGSIGFVTNDGIKARMNKRDLDSRSWHTYKDSASGTNCFQVTQVGQTVFLRNTKSPSFMITGSVAELKALVGSNQLKAAGISA